MTADEEHFQTYAEDGTPSGLVARSEVHRIGLLHRSVHIFVWNMADELLVTQRSADKDICHLIGTFPRRTPRPGETVRNGIRGLRENGIHSTCLNRA